MNWINRILLTFSIVLCSFDVMAEPIQEGKEYAQEMNTSVVQSTVNSTSTDPTIVPGYTGETPPEASYYDDGYGALNAGQQEANNSETGQFITGTMDERTKITINPQTDPMFQNYSAVRSSAEALTATYSGCVDLPVRSEANTYNLQTCNLTGAYASSNVTCDINQQAICPDGTPYRSFEDREITINIASKGRDWFTVDVNILSGSWVVVDPSDGVEEDVQLEGNGFDDFLCEQYQVEATFLGQSNWPESINLVSNSGTNRYDTSMTIRVLQQPNCGNGMVARFQVEDHQKEGMGDDPSWILGAQFRFNLKTTYCTLAFRETTTCDDGSWGVTNSATILSSTCLEAGNRNIGGEDIYNACWHRQSRYQVTKLAYTEDTACTNLRNNRCSFASKSCLSMSPQGDCISEQHSYKCPTSDVNESVTLCGSTLVCPDGNCTNDVGREQHDATEDFVNAATNMAVAEETVKHFDIESLTVFNGEAQTCEMRHLDIGGWAFDCCSGDGGMGHDCSAEEDNLVDAREAGFTHFIAEDEDNHGGYTDHNRRFCVYPSKLARIIMEQGKLQLNQNFGSFESPDCDGFTINELEQINFNEMDLSEYVDDVMEQAANGTAPSNSEASSALQTKFQNYQNQN